MADSASEWMHVLKPFTLNEEGISFSDDRKPPPWNSDLARLRDYDSKGYLSVDHGPDFDLSQAQPREKFENTMYQIEKKAWVRDQRQQGHYVQMNPQKSVIDQLDPSTKEFVVRVTPSGPNTTIYKYGKEIVHIGPFGEQRASPLKIFGFRMRYHWGKLNTCIKVAVGILVAAIIVGTIIGSVAGACLTGSLTDVVACGNLGIKVTGELPKITGRVILFSEETTTVMQSCHNVSCANGGSCSIENNSIKCTCIENYSGSRCEVESNINSTKTPKSTEATITTEATTATEGEQPTTGFPQAQTDKTTDPDRMLYIIGLVAGGIVLIGIIFAYYRVKSNKTAIQPPIVSTPRKRSTLKRKKSSTRSRHTRKRKSSKIARSKKKYIRQQYI